MPNVTLTFNHDINTSTQVGDVAYYVSTPPLGSTQVWASTTTPHDTAAREQVCEIGPILSIISTPTFSTIVCEMSVANIAACGLPTIGVFIMFSKDNKVNLGHLLGYYCDVQFRNSSKTAAEIFNIGSVFSESSK
jgi:hypothetical protein